MSIGSALAVAGAAMQGLFRNPLADPGLVGVSSGAAVAAVATIVLGAGTLDIAARTLGPFLLSVAAFGGGAATTLLVYRLSPDPRQRVGIHHAAGRHRHQRGGRGGHRNLHLRRRRPHSSAA